ncbi:MAG: aspartate-semialdehyde dehydrogenase [Rhodobacteraceae bacterium]|nr:aspartate-semialdehyde dehydrogenase [Paracoccaceae bacterium]
MGYRIAVAGATGNVGREMLAILAERKFPVAEIAALASSRSAGDEVTFGDGQITVGNLEEFDFSGWDMALFAVGAEATGKHAPRAAGAGCVVIDNSSLYRYDPEIPLIVPEVNSEAIADHSKRNIIANPNCSTAQMVVALKPLHDRARIRRIVVSTYQSVSGAGKAAMDELWNQTRSLYHQGETIEPNAFPVRIAFNVIPQIDKFLEDGSTKEEWKMVAETKRILDPNIEVSATCVRVPVFVGHSEAINVELEEPLSAEDARELLKTSPGIIVLDRREPAGYMTPMDCIGEYATFISRIRRDRTVKHGLNLWCVADNLRKGAALNAVQIGELLGRKVLKKG